MYEEKLKDEEIQYQKHQLEIQHLEEKEREMLAKLKDTQAKEQQSIGQLSDALDESKAALKDRLVAISADRTP